MAKAVKIISYETLKALYFSGKVKPSLNKILAELEKDPKNLELTLLACKCLHRSKGYEQLAELADTAIKTDPTNAAGYYYKGVALQNTKGKEQEALKNLNDALSLDPENTLYLKDKATTHLLLYRDYHLPLAFAEKHRIKSEDTLLKIIELVEAKESTNYIEYLTIADVYMTIKKNLDAKKYYIKAVNDYEKTEEVDQDKNIYKDIIKAQKACIKECEKFTE